MEGLWGYAAEEDSVGRWETEASNKRYRKTAAWKEHEDDRELKEATRKVWSEQEDLSEAILFLVAQLFI